MVARWPEITDGSQGGPRDPSQKNNAGRTPGVITRNIPHVPTSAQSRIFLCREFSRRFNCSADRLGPQQIREYQAERFEKRKLSPGSVAVRLAALVPRP
jgi:hypothetical protein